VILPSRFLEEIHLLINPKTVVLPDNFKSDLSKSEEVKKNPSTEDYHSLGNILNKFRSSTINEVKDLISRDKDDPLFCPISLFESMEYGRLEVANTRTLAWLLNPHAKHDFNNLLLSKLINYKFNKEIKNNFSVDCEVDCPSYGRLDILADCHEEKWVLVIEAKIDSPERDDQLFDYDNWLERHRKGYSSMKLFLTQDGKIGKTDKRKEWVQSTFFEVAMIFHEAYKELKISNKDSQSLPFLKYYICGLLSDLSGFHLPLVEDNWEKKNNIYRLMKILRFEINKVRSNS
jgi:PD-(D/E)XK nuclease superfamily